MITLNWPAPKNICAFSTTRSISGKSHAPYDSFNLSSTVGDDIQCVLANRKKLKDLLQLPSEPIWLEQQHGNNIIDAANYSTIKADGAYTNNKKIVCAILTADCLPLLLCNSSGTEVAALHCGWRGIAKGIIEQGIKKFQSPPKEILVWLGPAIGPNHFEVGDEVRTEFVSYDKKAEKAFKSHKTASNFSRDKKYLADIYELAKQRLERCGVNKIYGGDFCTYSDSKLFYSYRRDHQTGRMASIIWFE